MADALASGASVRKDVGVQVPPRPPLLGRMTRKSVFKRPRCGSRCTLVLDERLSEARSGRRRAPGVERSVEPHPHRRIGRDEVVGPLRVASPAGWWFSRRAPRRALSRRRRRWRMERRPWPVRDPAGRSDSSGGVWNGATVERVMLGPLQTRRRQCVRDARARCSIEQRAKSGSPCLGDAKPAFAGRAPFQASTLHQDVGESGGDRTGEMEPSLGPVETLPQRWPPGGRKRLHVQACAEEPRFPSRPQREAVSSDDETVTTDQRVVDRHAKFTGDVVVAQTSRSECSCRGRLS
jgi:hypothetical protein